MPDERGIRELPALFPMPHPKEDRCGHDFEIPFCPYQRCAARQLYESLKEQRAFMPLAACQKGLIDRDGIGKCRCERCKDERADSALAKATGTTLPSRPAVGGETEKEIR